MTRYGRTTGQQRTRRDAGFTIIELMVVMLICGLIAALVVPNLGAFVPKARLDAAAKIITNNIDFLRSEARIQSKRYVLELDLKHARWRRVLPPELQLTTDQDESALEPQYEDWTPLEQDVMFAGAGNAVDGMTHDGVFRLVFDENGFTGDQVVLLKLISDPTMVWTVQIRGITGQCDLITDFNGHEHLLDEVGEGAF